MYKTFKKFIIETLLKILLTNKEYEKMENNFNSPSECVDLNIKGGIVKANLPIIKMILLGIMAGAFIAIGAEGSNLAMHNISDVGLARTLAGAVFPVGLMMLVLIGGELFTGNCLLIMGVLDKKFSATKMIINLIIVHMSNFIGAFLVAYGMFACGQFNYSSGGLGAFTIKVAIAKLAISPSSAIISGIFCNILVCAAILMATAAKDIAGKCIAMFFPIFVFVISGFEHCVANMYYIPAGIIASKNAEYVQKAQELYGITTEQIQNLNYSNMYISNILPVTLGNIIGGMLR